MTLARTEFETELNRNLTPATAPAVVPFIAFPRR
jgi:hypothetical protein